MSAMTRIEARAKGVMLHVQAIHNRHHPTPSKVCWKCKEDWPCDAAYLLAELRDREEKLEAVSKELASAPPSPRVRRMECILKGGK